jgi:branched-chain amino acid transport system ATP-binding protein
LRMGGYARNYPRSVLNARIQAACVEFPVLATRLAARAAELSGGQQQMLALARAWVADPEVLLLDEPSTGLAPLFVAEVLAKIQGLKKAGKIIILAEQHIQQALQCADRAYVLKGGRIVLDGPAARLLEAPEIKQAYLGFEKQPQAEGPPASIPIVNHENRRPNP